jgi:hypothetical protein
MARYFATIGRLLAALSLFYTVYSASTPFHTFINHLFTTELRNQLAFIFLCFLSVELLLAFINQERRVKLARKCLSEEVGALRTQNIQLESKLSAQLATGHQVTAEDFEVALVAYIKSLSSKQCYLHVMRLHSALSRYLWVEGLLTARVALGDASEAAAVQLSDKEGQLSALIDDVGWTLVAKKEFQKASEKIKFGQHLAQEWSNPYWISKAQRHLAGIATIQRQFGEADKHLQDAESTSSAIPDADEKVSMLAGIEYGRAIVDLMRGQYDTAMQHIEQSDALRMQGADQTRIVRSFALRGKILLAKNDPISIGEAKNQFRQGLARATDIGRRDEIIRNHNGLAQIAKLEADEKAAQYHKGLARELSRDTPVPYEIEDQQ